MGRRGGGAHELGEKKEKRVTYLNLHKNATHLSCCPCTTDMRAGGLQVAGHETCEDRTMVAIIQTVRER